MRLPVIDPAFVSALRTQVRGEVRTTEHDRMLYATDASIYQVAPVAVVIPRDAQDVQAAVACCHAYGAAILPRGAGTSLAGQTVNTAVVLDLSRYCNSIIEVDVERRRARIEPGVVLDRLNEAAGVHGLMFGPDVATSSHASLGGMIGNNSAGAHSILYHRTVEHLAEVEFLLADGRQVSLKRGAAAHDPVVADLTRRVVAVVEPLADEIEARFPRTLRRVDGYNLDLMLQQIRASSPGTHDAINLAHLVCGAEGTLGVVLEATLDMVPQPGAKGLTIVAFDGIDAALEAVLPILKLNPSAVELIDHVILDLAEHNLEHRRYLNVLPAALEGQGRPGAVLYVEFFRETDDQVLQAMDQLGERYSPSRVRRLLDAGEMSSAWKLRKAGEPLLYGRPGVRKPLTFIEDTVVEPSHLPEFICRFRELLARHGTEASYYAHASVGCLHIRPMIDLRNAADSTAMERIVKEATDLVRQYGGALSGEHGDGRLRSPFLEQFYGPKLCRGFADIKSIFDPGNLMNPGNITSPEPMTQRLRVRPDEQVVTVPQVTTYFRYEREHGFGPAVELCNGAGVCRRTEGGTMCPSYRATLDERHATRGRGNALRLAVTGQQGVSEAPGAPAWNDPETLATLDLCLSCKACKRECPSNVDVARLKSEYLAHSFAAAGGAPWSTRMLAEPRRIMRLAAALGPLFRSALQGRVGRAAAARWLNIDRRRSLPAVGGSLQWWLKSRPRVEVAPDAPVVVLLPDCFSAYGEVAVGQHAVLALEHLGYRVVVPSMGCCGRPQLSLGLLPEAIETCRKAAGILCRTVAKHDAVAIVGCEPSCVSAVVDDWQDLDARIAPADLQMLAQRCCSVEDFIEGRWNAHRRQGQLQANSDGPRVLLHGHCHQKALWGIDATESLLRRVVGDRLTVLEAGCCGMAGAFGQTSDHYELSMRIGDLGLFPAVRRHAGAQVVAPGTSCRHQLRDAMGVQAMHPIELIGQAIVR
jgi:FAD/FMN-containing dehydrogenase/Fe-S oxidoreductase